MTYRFPSEAGCSTNLSKYNLIRRSLSSNPGRPNSIILSNLSFMAESNCCGVFEANTSMIRLLWSEVRQRKALRAARRSSLSCVDERLWRNASASSMNNRTPERKKITLINIFLLFLLCYCCCFQYSFIEICFQFFIIQYFSHLVTLSIIKTGLVSN